MLQVQDIPSANQSGANHYPHSKGVFRSSGRQARQTRKHNYNHNLKVLQKRGLVGLVVHTDKPDIDSSIKKTGIA